MPGQVIGEHGSQEWRIGEPAPEFFCHNRDLDTGGAVGT
ncbi:hypothetical protein I551_0642 [Mycobacterium ulcerans str. Harvey]|uniref:Uncharacterized protein n=1 Tax=Mycobacterium ulcerans str. Harvey TaxID=1299332 RepID=A0ABP3AT96_MYCUL|nr:hypothetical protein I551_0642 [Mycobacterium ulcerans str. Harvey]